MPILRGSHQRKKVGNGQRTAQTSVIREKSLTIGAEAVRSRAKTGSAALGDSITYGYGGDVSYPSQLRRLLGWRHWSVEKYGVSGTYARRHQCHHEGIGAARTTDGVLTARKLAERRRRRRGHRRRRGRHAAVARTAHLARGGSTLPELLLNLPEEDF